MFTKSTFPVRKDKTYPPFGLVVQSWYSPLMTAKPQDDEGLTACVTLGIARREWVNQKTNTTHRTQIILASIVQDHLKTSQQLKKYVTALSTDYRTKTSKVVAGNRGADVVLMEAEFGKPCWVAETFGLNNIQLCCPELFGDTLDRRISIAYPYLNQIFFTTLPDDAGLRPDDAHLLGMLLAYPSSDSYALAAALIQAVLWIKTAGYFENLPSS